ncbi:MAG: hypothetical protein M3394_03410 [Actinomycetota bacterium]|nr:hypothetical protein [Actinomycetota bacterium]
MGPVRIGRRGRGRSVLGVTLLAAVMFIPTDASASRNIGSGVVHGTAQFVAPGLPPATAVCQLADFNLVDSLAIGFALNTVVTGFVGELSLTGGGEATCGTATASAGSLSLTVTGTGPTGSQFDCPLLTGFFDRTAVVVRVTLTGRCVVNEFERGLRDVQFLSQLVFTPVPPGAGVTSNLMTSNFDGTFAVFPAEG